MEVITDTLLPCIQGMLLLDCHVMNTLCLPPFHSTFVLSSLLLAPQHASLTVSNRRSAVIQPSFALLHTPPHYTTLHYITLHYTTSHYTTLRYTTSHYTTLHHTTLPYTTLHCTTLHYITLHYTSCLNCAEVCHTLLCSAMLHPTTLVCSHMLIAVSVLYRWERTELQYSQI